MANFELLTEGEVDDRVLHDLAATFEQIAAHVSARTSGDTTSQAGAP